MVHFFDEPIQPPFPRNQLRAQTTEGIQKGDSMNDTKQKTCGMRVRGALFPVLTVAYLALIFGLPLAVCSTLWRATEAKWQPVTLLLLPLLFTGAFSGVAGMLSLPHQKGIVAGKFPRDVCHPIYFHRRLYGICWTALFYFKPVYFLVLTIPFLKMGTFRLFGYRGNLDFTIYPDTWIRDLPLLHFGLGAYLSNKSTLGSNIVLPNGRILVGPLVVEEGAVVGHASMIAPGCHVGKRAEIGVGCGLALNVRVGDRAKIAGLCGIDNGAYIGEGATVGPMTLVATQARVQGGMQIPPASFIPKRANVDKPTAPFVIPLKPSPEMTCQPV